MSLARQLFRDMRPLFRMLEEPLARPPSYFGALPSMIRSDFLELNNTRPAIDVSDQGDKYILDADLPGVKKDNLEIRIGDNGRSVTIEGRVVETGGEAPKDQAALGEPGKASDLKVAAKTEENENAVRLASERPYTRNVSFTRTVWLPRPVDPKGVNAKLDHGVLTITVKKAEDTASTVIPISD